MPLGTLSLHNGANSGTSRACPAHEPMKGNYANAKVIEFWCWSFYVCPQLFQWNELADHDMDKMITVWQKELI